MCLELVCIFVVVETMSREHEATMRNRIRILYTKKTYPYTYKSSCYAKYFVWELLFVYMEYFFRTIAAVRKL